eukprot:CAMPEP_0197009102 /NCGR_PEP_ID=MMETSP1380-20130617/48511_1 /TAXON_ID=5936 /ORGANISM="Euplotes crassus, Strain CT5" /LENGTH=74 /DNA_ID=CAMNT_0042430123 /DNA_START=400 /DNA_END=624 /DNA_ORIENTATION=+
MNKEISVSGVDDSDNDSSKDLEDGIKSAKSIEDAESVECEGEDAKSFIGDSENGENSEEAKPKKNPNSLGQSVM